VKTEIYKCDCCGAEKDSTNHWFGIVVASSRLTVGPLSDEMSVVALSGRAGLAYTFHLCGESCTTKTVSKFLGNGEIRWPQSGGAQHV
jgi:hypothetical protein